MTLRVSTSSEMATSSEFSLASGVVEISSGFSSGAACVEAPFP